MDIARIPKNKMIIANLFLVEILLTARRIYPNSRLKQAQRTLTNGEESPFPGGLENGVGNASPETPWIKCGTTFAKNAPAKNTAT